MIGTGSLFFYIIHLNLVPHLESIFKETAPHKTRVHFRLQGYVQLSRPFRRTETILQYDATLRIDVRLCNPGRETMSSPEVRRPPDDYDKTRSSYRRAQAAGRTRGAPPISPLLHPTALFFPI